MTPRPAVAYFRRTNSLLGVLLGLGYTAVFDGDTTFTGSSGTGVFIG